MNKAQRTDINKSENVVKGKPETKVSTELWESASDLRSYPKKGEKSYFFKLNRLHLIVIMTHWSTIQNLSYVETTLFSLIKIVKLKVAL